MDKTRIGLLFFYDSLRLSYLIDLYRYHLKNNIYLYDC